MWIELPKHVLREAPWNYKTTDAKLMKKLERNMIKNGIVQNLIVRPISGGFYEVVNGNHRLKIIETMRIDKVMCFNLGNVSETKAKRIALETNETNFGRDDGKMNNLIKEISADIDETDFATTLDDEILSIHKIIDSKPFEITEAANKPPAKQSELVYSTSPDKHKEPDNSSTYLFSNSQNKYIQDDELKTIKHVVPADVKLLYDRQILRIAAIGKAEGKNLSTTQCIEIMVQATADLTDLQLKDDFIC